VLKGVASIKLQCRDRRDLIRLHYFNPEDNIAVGVFSVRRQSLLEADEHSEGAWFVVRYRCLRDSFPHRGLELPQLGQWIDWASSSASHLSWASIIAATVPSLAMSR
jgi:hypothetical protein